MIFSTAVYIMYYYAMYGILVYFYFWLLISVYMVVTAFELATVKNLFLQLELL